MGKIIRRAIHLTLRLTDSIRHEPGAKTSTLSFGFKPRVRSGASFVSPRGREGFTLFEVMVTVAILAIGLVVIYEALFTCLNGFSYYLNYLTVQCWMNEKIWKAEDYIVRSEDEMIEEDTAGEVMIRNKKIGWQMSIKPISEGSLYQLSLICSWPEGLREVNTSRVAYAGM